MQSNRGSSFTAFELFATRWTAQHQPPAVQIYRDEGMALPYFASVFDTLKDQAKDAIWALSSCLCQQSAKIKINGRTCQYTVVMLSEVRSNCHTLVGAFG